MQRAILSKLGHDLHTLLADSDELLRATAGAPGERINAARARAEESLRNIRDRISVAEREVIGRARSADDYVHENPWRSIAITSGLAFLVGVLIGRRAGVSTEMICS